MSTKLFVIRDFSDGDILGIFSCKKQAYISYVKVWWDKYGKKYYKENEKIKKMLNNPFLYTVEEWQNVVKEETPFYNDMMTIVTYELDKYYY